MLVHSRAASQPGYVGPVAFGHRPTYKQVGLRPTCLYRAVGPFGAHGPTYTRPLAFGQWPCVYAAHLRWAAYVGLRPPLGGRRPYTGERGRRPRSPVYGGGAPKGPRPTCTRCPKGTGCMFSTAARPEGPGSCARAPGPEGARCLHTWAAEGGPRVYVGLARWAKPSGQGPMQVGRRRRPTCIRAHVGRAKPGPHVHSGSRRSRLPGGQVGRGL